VLATQPLYADTCAHVVPLANASSSSTRSVIVPGARALHTPPHPRPHRRHPGRNCPMSPRLRCIRRTRRGRARKSRRSAISMPASARGRLRRTAVGARAILAWCAARSLEPGRISGSCGEPVVADVLLVLGDARARGSADRTPVPAPCRLVRDPLLPGAWHRRYTLIEARRQGAGLTLVSTMVTLQQAALRRRHRRRAARGAARRRTCPDARRSRARRSHGPRLRRRRADSREAGVTRESSPARAMQARH
jgi:hypothetical protein